MTCRRLFREPWRRSLVLARSADWMPRNFFRARRGAVPRSRPPSARRVLDELFPMEIKDTRMPGNSTSMVAYLPWCGPTAEPSFCRARTTSWAARRPGARVRMTAVRAGGRICRLTATQTASLRHRDDRAGAFRAQASSLQPMQPGMAALRSESPSIGRCAPRRTESLNREAACDEILNASCPASVHSLPRTTGALDRFLLDVHPGRIVAA